MKQVLSRIGVYWHNAKQCCALFPSYQVLCDDCGKVQDRLVGWTHQRCDRCGGYLYDER